MKEILKFGNMKPPENQKPEEELRVLISILFFQNLTADQSGCH